MSSANHFRKYFPGKGAGSYTNLPVATAAPSALHSVFVPDDLHAQFERQFSQTTSIPDRQGKCQTALW